MGQCMYVQYLQSGDNPFIYTSHWSFNTDGNAFYSLWYNSREETNLFTSNIIVMHNLKKYMNMSKLVNAPARCSTDIRPSICKMEIGPIKCKSSFAACPIQCIFSFLLFCSVLRMALNLKNMTGRKQIFSVQICYLKKKNKCICSHSKNFWSSDNPKSILSTERNDTITVYYNY